jgi:hypothetical protein
MQRFKDNQRGLEELARQMELKQSDSLTYRTKGAQFAQSRMGVVLGDSDPDVLFDRAYQVEGQYRETVASGYFAAEKARLIGEAPNDKLAKIVLGIHHEPVSGDADRDAVIEAIKRYSSLKALNQAYDSDGTIQTKGGELKVTREVLVQEALPYVFKKIDDAYGESNPDNKYITPELLNQIKATAELILKSSSASARATTGQMEAENKAKYEGLLPNDVTKAAFARTSLNVDPKEGRARAELYHAVK